jgi:hypothetical protein
MSGFNILDFSPLAVPSSKSYKTVILTARQWSEHLFHKEFCLLFNKEIKYDYPSINNH